MSKNKILITGALGLTGKACAELFLKKEWEVHGIDTNMRAHFFDTEVQEPNGEVHFFGIDIRDENAINALFDKERFDAVIHTAAQPSHDYSTDHALEDFDINARGTLVLLEATRKYCPEAVFVHVSTDKVYGDRFPNNDLADEQLGLDFAGVRSLFGCSKAAADMYVQEYGNKFGMNTVCFRMGCITGKNHQGAEQHGFLAYLAKCIKEGKTYTIYGDGKQVRDQIHANDAAYAFSCFIDNPRVAAVYNLGGGSERAVSIMEAAELIKEATDKPFVYELGEARQGDRIYDVHDVSKFRTDYPKFQYQYSLQDIIKDITL